jgi:hypothetical protein
VSGGIHIIARPFESHIDWWGNAGFGSVRREADIAAGRDREFDFERHFLRDLPDDARAQLLWT